MLFSAVMRLGAFSKLAEVVRCLTIFPSYVLLPHLRPLFISVSLTGFPPSLVSHPGFDFAGVLSADSSDMEMSP